MKLIKILSLFFISYQVCFAAAPVSSIRESIQVISTTTGKTSRIFPGDYVQIQGGIQNISNNTQTVYQTDENGRRLSNEAYRVSRKWLFKSVATQFNNQLQFVDSLGKTVNSISPIKVVILEDIEGAWDHYKIALIDDDNNIIDHNGNTVSNNKLNQSYYKISKSSYEDALLKQLAENNNIQLRSTDSATEAPVCTDCNHERTVLGLDTSQNEAPTPQFSSNHRQSHADSYSKCNADTPARHEAYMSQIKPHLESVTSTLFDGQDMDILTCLYLRESDGWRRSANSGTGAVGLAQFTAGTADDYGDIVRGSPKYWQGMIDEQLKTNAENKRLYDNSVRKNNSARAARWNEEVKAGEDLLRSYKKFHYLSTQWEELNFEGKTRRFPNNNYTNIRNYFRDNNNYKNILALSGLKIKACLYDLAQQGYKIEKRKMMYICVAGYNMGEADLVKLIKNISKTNSRDHNLKNWVDAIQESNHSQKDQTTDHLISIHRCSDPTNTYPPCNTGASHCQEFYVDACQNNEDVICVKERSNKCNR